MQYFEEVTYSPIRLCLFCLINCYLTFGDAGHSPVIGRNSLEQDAHKGTFCNITSNNSFKGDSKGSGMFTSLINRRKQWKLDMLVVDEVNTSRNAFTSYGLDMLHKILDKTLTDTIPTGKIGDPVFDKIFVIENIVQREQWRLCHIITKGEMISKFQNRLHIDDCVLRYLEVETIETHLIQEFQHVTVMEPKGKKRSFMNFIVIDDTEQIINVMQKMEEIDTRHGVDIILRHFSKWVLIPFHGRINISTTFDNVAIIEGENEVIQQSNLTEVIPTIMKRHQLCLQLELHICQEELKQMIEWLTEGRTATISTLMWEEQGRVPSHVATLACNGKVKWNSQLFPNVEYGLNGRTLRLTIKEWVPFVIKTKTANETTYEGVCPSMVKALAHTFNFTYIFTEPADGQWGQIDGEKWTGLIGDVHNKIADMSGVWLGKDYHRSKVVDFSAIMRISPYTIAYIRLPEEYPLTYLVRQFKKEVYIYGFAMFVGVIMLLFLIEYTHPIHNDDAERSCYKRTGELTLMLAASALHQGVTKHPCTGAGRVLMAFWWLYTLIITAVYCGNLIAYRAVTKDINPLKSLSEMLDRENFVFGFEGKSLLENILKLSNDVELKRLWKRMTKTMETDPTVTDPGRSIHYKRLLGGNYAFIIDGMSFDTFKKDDCRIVNMETGFLPTPYGFVFPQNSPLPKLFSNELMMFVENGMVEMLTKKWIKGDQCEESKNVAKPMIILDYIGVIIASVLGICISSGVLMLEAVISKKMKLKLRKQEK